jgi:hypothetical protein
MAMQLQMLFCNQNIETKQPATKESLEEYCKQILEKMNSKPVE